MDEIQDPEQFLREHVAFVMRTMQRSLMGSEIEKASVRHWIELLQASLDGTPFDQIWADSRPSE